MCMLLLPRHGRQPRRSTFGRFVKKGSGSARAVTPTGRRPGEVRRAAVCASGTTRGRQIKFRERSRAFPPYVHDYSPRSRQDSLAMPQSQFSVYFANRNRANRHELVRPAYSAAGHPCSRSFCKQER